MLVNIGIWQDKGMFGEFGGDGRGVHRTRGIAAFITPFGSTIEGLPAWPTFETLVAILVLVGAIYYASRFAVGPPTSRRTLATGEAIDRLSRSGSRIQAARRAIGAPPPSPAASDGA